MRKKGKNPQPFLKSFLFFVKNMFLLVSKNRKRKRLELEKLAAQEEKRQEALVKEVEKKKEAIQVKTEIIHRQLETEKQAIEAQLDKEMQAIQRSTKTSFKKLAPVHNYLRTKSKLYYVWHLNPYSSTLHFGALLFFIGASVYFMQSIYPSMYQKALADNESCLWKGTTSSDWDTATNWSCGIGSSERVPDASDTIYFNSAYNNALTMTASKTVAGVSSTSGGGYTSTFDLNDYTLTISKDTGGNVTWQSGTLDGDDSDIFLNGNLEITGGTFNKDTTKITLNGSLDTTLNSSKDLYDLVIEKETSADIVTLSTNNANVTGDFYLNSGVLNKTSSEKVNISASGKTYYLGAESGGGSVTVELSYAGDSQYIMASGGTATSNTTVSGSGNVYWDGSATLKNLNHNEGTLTIRSGKLIIPNDNAVGKIACSASTTLNFDGNANIGISTVTSLLILRSDSPSNQWDLEKNATCTVTADWTDIKDSNNTDSGSGDIVTSNSIDSGNNTGWDFTTNGELANVNYWTNNNGAGNNSWDSDSNWSAGHKPTVTEYAYFGSDHNDNCNLASETTTLGVFSSDYTGTLATGGNSLDAYNLKSNALFYWASGTFNGSNSALTFGNTFIAGGTVTLTSNQTTIGVGSFYQYGGTLNHNSGTVDFFNGCGYVYAKDSLYNIELEGVACSGNINIVDTLHVANQATFTEGYTSYGDIDVDGAISVASTYDGSSGDSEIIIDNSAVDQSFVVPNGASAPGIYLNNSQTTVSFASNAVSSMSKLELHSGTFIPSNNQVTVVNGVNFLQYGGTFNHNSGKMIFANGCANIRPKDNFYDVEFNGGSCGGAKTIFGANMVVENDVLFNNGYVSSSNTLDVKGDITIDATANLSSVPILFSGTTDQTYTYSAGVSSNGAITINKTSGKAIFAGSGAIKSNISLTSGILEFNSPGNTFTFDNGKTITTSANTTLRFVGEDGNHTALTSSGTWNIADSGTTYAKDVTVTNSVNSSGTIYALSSTDGTGNTGWDFSETSYSWDGGASTNDWNTAANWNPDGTPDANDIVTIDYAGSAVTTSGAISFGSLTVGGSNASGLTISQAITSGGDLTISSLGTVTQATAWDTQLVLLGNLTVNGSDADNTALLTHSANSTSKTYRLNLSVLNNVSVGEFGLIDATSKGYDNGPGSGSESTGAGATYGGQGSRNSSVGTYDSATNPEELGSGVSIPAVPEKKGGGAIKMNVFGTATVNGKIRSNGRTNEIFGESERYATSGGSVNITVSDLSGSGSIEADGGDTAVIWPSHGGGGGGRIAINLISASSLSFSNIHAYSSTVGSSYLGSAGTVYIKTVGQTKGEIIVDNNDVESLNPVGQLSPSTLIPDDSGVNEWDFDLISVDNKGIITVPSGATLTIASNSVLGNSNGTSDGIIAISGGTVNVPGDFTISKCTFEYNAPDNGATQGELMGLSNLTIASDGVLSHTRNNDTEINKLNLLVPGNLVVNGRIDTTGKGYYLNMGPGRGHNGSGYGSGYGGSGGKYHESYGKTYGDYANPINIGSGGGISGIYNHSYAGGAIILEVGGTTTVSESGGIDSDPVSETGGSGGTVNITTAYIAGSGDISANGSAPNGCCSGGSGGGGRVAIRLTAENSFDNYTGTISAYGNSTQNDSSNGTVFLKTANQTNGSLLIDGNNVPGVSAGYTDVYATLCGESENYDSTCASNINIDSIILRNYGRLSLEQNQVVNVGGDISNDANSKLIFSPDNDGDPLAGAWPTLNVSGDLNNSGSIISNGQGYPAQNGYTNAKGGVGTTYGGGAGFGGNGGAGAGGDGTGGQSYGSATDTNYIGSGGGLSTGGAGGGHIHLNIDGTLNNNTATSLIQANGNAGSTNGGGGSGGGILIETTNLTCNTAGATISANGGNGASEGGGGGAGGRIMAVVTGTRTVDNCTIIAQGGSGGSGASSGSSSGPNIQASPVQPSQTLPADTATNQSQETEFTFSTTDPDSDWLRYKLELATQENFSLWYSTDWDNRKTITIDHTKVGSDLTDFPVLIYLESDSDLASKAQDDFDDILFASSDGVTKLSHQIENYNPDTGMLRADVKIPNLSSTQDTILYLYYGNNTCADQQNITDVWSSGIAGVWLMNEGSGTTVHDYSGNNNHGTLTNMDSGDWVAGENGGWALDFDGNGDRVNVLNSATINISGAITVWAQSRTDSYSAYDCYLHKHNIYRLWEGATGYYGGTIITGSGTSTANSNVLVSSHFGEVVDSAITWDGASTAASSWVNGSLAGTGLSIDGTMGSMWDLGIGGTPEADTRSIDGQIFSARVYNRALPSGEISTLNANQSSPTSFLSIGEEQISSYGPVFTFTQGSTAETQTQTSGGVTGTFSGQNSQSGTAYSSGSTVTFTIDAGTPLIESQTYYWRVSAIDPEGVDSYDGNPHYSTPSSTRSFTVAPIDQLSYTSGTGQTIRAAGSSSDTCSAVFDFEILNSIDETVKLRADDPHTYTLSDGDSGGQFFTTSDCSGSALSPAQLTIAEGSSSAEFYYKNTSPSLTPYTITVAESPQQDPDWSDAQTTIQVNPGILDHFVLSDYQTTVTTEQTFSATVTAYDAQDNVKFDYYGTEANIWFSSSADNYAYPTVLPATSSSKYQFLSGDHGSKTFTNAFQIKKTGSNTIVLHHDAYDGKSQDQLTLTSNTITVNPGATHRFELNDYPRAVNPSYPYYAVSGFEWSESEGASDDFDMNVTVRDQFNNIKSDYDGSIYFTLYTAQGEPAADYDFYWDASNRLVFDPNTDQGQKQANGIAGDYSYFVSDTAGKTLDLRISDGTVTTQGAYTIYIKPLELDHFAITTNQTLSRLGTVNDQDNDEEWDHDDTPVSVTVTAYDTRGNVKVDYGYNEATGEGRIYFYSPERSVQSGGELVVNKEFPYYKTSSSDLSASFEFPIESAGVHTFIVEDEIFKFFKGGRRTIYVAESITPSDSYGIEKNLKDPNFSDALWDDRTENVKTGVLPVGSTVAVETHVPGSTHTNDDHSDNSNNNITIGPGDEKLVLSWQNPFDLPASAEPKIYFYQSTDGTDYSLLSSPRPNAVGAGQWQSAEVTGLTNDQQYWYKLCLGYKRSDGTYILSDYSNVVSETPKAIAPVNVVASQIDKDGEDGQHFGQVKTTYSLRFESSTTFSYFNPVTLTWNDITDSAVSGDKGILSGDFDDPVLHTTYFEMNDDFDGYYLNGSFKIRVNVSVDGQGSSNSESNLFTLDTKNPHNASLVIDATANTTADLAISASDDSAPIRMMLSNEADFSEAEWQDYTTSIEGYNIEGVSTIYIKFMDEYYNETEISTQVGEMPASFAVKDASNIEDGEYRLVLIWRTIEGVDHYNIWRSENGEDYTKVDTTTKNGYLDINLSNELTYYYKITSEDANSNISLPAGPLSSRPGSAPDVTSDPLVELFGWRQEYGVRAKITWNTDQEADSFIVYSKEELEEGVSTKTKSGADALIAGDVSMTLNHEVMLYHLDPSTKYYFKSLSKNEIQITGASNVLDFTTPERIPLLIQGMTISDITISSAQVTWSTTKLSTTIMQYSTTAISGDSVSADATTITDSDMNTSHSFKLDNLVSGAKYYLRVRSTDSDSNTTISDIYTFSTFAMPLISNVSIKETSYNTATVEWQTNVNTDSNVEYSSQNTELRIENSAEGTGASDSNQTSSSEHAGMQGKNDSTTVHLVTLIGLVPKTTYTYRVISSDQFGNSASSQILSFTTATDTISPQISSVKSEVASTGSGETIKYQAIISWDTDEPATSQIEYAQGIGGDYTDKSLEVESLNSAHVVILPDLKPNSAYHFRIVSKDLVGNIAYSDDISLITPPKEKSLLQVIIKSLEDTFSWVGRLREKWFGE